MIKDIFNQSVQNKNIVMFTTAVFFMSGILSYFNDCALPVTIIITVLLLVLHFKKYISFKYILLWAFIFYIGYFNAATRIKDTDVLVKLAPADVVMTGRIVSIPTGNSPDKHKFFFKVSSINNEKIAGKTLVNVTDENKDFSNLNIGNTYKITGKLRLPFKASNPSQFDYGKYLRNFNTYTIVYAENSNCEKLDEKMGIKWAFLNELNKVRNSILSTHAKYLKSPYLEILGGIVFGDDAVAPPDYVKDSFKNSGLLHILAASGMNVAFIYGFWYFILRRLRAPVKFTIISGMVVVILYTLMTGLGASVVRAALMLLFVLAGKLIDRDSHSVSLLAFVASLMLLYNPAYINDVGFQLSFIVTFGLLTTANFVMAKIEKLKIPNWLAGAILVPIVAQFWVIPLQMFYFNTISTYSILANVSIIPFLSIISFGGFVSSVLAIITPIAKYVCFVFDIVLKYCLIVLVWISDFFSNLPYSMFETTHPSVLQVVLYYIILLIITLMFKTGFNKKTVITVCSLVTILALSTVSLGNHNLEIIAFDVQNADAFLIKTPKNKYFAIDTGKAGYNGGKTQAEVIILKYLKDRGIKELEGLIITHFDTDHSGGAADLINKLKINKIYINSTDNEGFTSNNIYKSIKDKQIDTVVVNDTNTMYQEDNLKMINLRPHGKTDNENSIITLLSYNDFQMLFMGDAGVEAFESIKASLPAERLEVLKVGHHGARGVVDESMVKTINPVVSLISTGRNTFGHPNKSTLDTLRNTDIYRTDYNNSIKISVNDKNYRLLTYDKNRHKYKVYKTY